MPEELIFKDEEGNENEDDVLIMGEFNEWNPVSMKKTEDCVFYHEVYVIGGYKYRYQFIINWEISIDESMPFDESKTGRTTNYILVSQPLPSDLSELPSL